MTRRELEVYRLVLAGKSNKEIAAAMAITVRTVRFHMGNILKKAHATDRIELLAALLKRAAQEPFPGAA